MDVAEIQRVGRGDIVECCGSGFDQGQRTLNPLRRKDLRQLFGL